MPNAIFQLLFFGLQIFSATLCHITLESLLRLYVDMLQKKTGMWWKSLKAVEWIIITFFNVSNVKTTPLIIKKVLSRESVWLEPFFLVCNVFILFYLQGVFISGMGKLPLQMLLESHSQHPWLLALLAGTDGCWRAKGSHSHHILESIIKMVPEVVWLVLSPHLPASSFCCICNCVSCCKRSLLCCIRQGQGWERNLVQFAFQGKPT